jgi:peptidyl-prolyl cis-trans isomerase A (cyclophilin A)
MNAHRSAPLALIVPALAAFLLSAGCSKTDDPHSSTAAAIGSAAAAASATSASTAASPPGTDVAPTTAPAAPASSTPLASQVHPDLLDPSKSSEKAPNTFKAKFTTTKGDFVVEVHRDWAPNGADRFYNLVKSGYFDNTRFFRNVDGFMVQFGISGDPAVNAKWQSSNITDDPVNQSNKRGFVTFAQTSLPNSRSTQVFINYGDNSRLDGMRFAPFGQVVQGMDVVDSTFKGYGERPVQPLIQSQGNAYLDTSFPQLDAIKHAAIVK